MTGTGDERTPGDGAPRGEESADAGPPDEASTQGATPTQVEASADGGPPPLAAARYADGSVSYPPHPVGPDGSEPVETVDLSTHTAEVVTWTTAHAPPPGVASPNHLAIVEFDVDGTPVRALGQLTTADVQIGDAVEPVYCEELRDPDAGVREPDSQSWDGYRFRPL